MNLLIKQGAGEGAVGVHQVAAAVFHGGLGVPRHQHDDVDGQAQDDGAVVPKEPASPRQQEPQRAFCDY